MDLERKRHIIFTIWIAIAVISNLLAFAGYGAALSGDFDQLGITVSRNMAILLIVGAILNIVFVAMLFFWNKYGFWGILVMSLISFYFNYAIGIETSKLVLGLISPLLLYFILQFKAENESGWNNLEYRNKIFSLVPIVASIIIFIISFIIK